MKEEAGAGAGEAKQAPALDVYEVSTEEDKADEEDEEE